MRGDRCDPAVTIARADDVVGARAILEDLGSKNGTFHRGQALTTPVRLEDGDEFTVGEVAAPIRFHVLGESATTRTGTKKRPD